jgi:transposase-like protein
VKRKRYSRKFQRMAVERLRTCDAVNELAQELGVTRRGLYKWRVKLKTIEPGEHASRPSTHTSSYRKQIHQLKRMLAEKAMEVNFFKGALQKVEARRQKKTELARWHLRPNPRSDVIARQPMHRAYV